MGMWPDVDRCPWPDALAFPNHLTVFDLVYVPSQTRLLQRAASAGARTIGGLGMLVHQGAAAFRLWTGLEPPLETLVEACGQVLGGER
jgi:shikimate dehydrogenase